jgi:hypothetical protein
MTDKEIEKLIETECGIHERSMRGFDQYLTALSAAALTFALNYFDKHAGGFSACLIGFFVLVIAALLVALISVVLSQWTSAAMSRSKIKQFRAIMDGNDDGRAKAKAAREKWDDWTILLGKIGTWSLSAGVLLFVVLLVWTTIINADNRKRAEEETWTTKERHEQTTTTVTETSTTTTSTMNDRDEHQYSKPDPKPHEPQVTPPLHDRRRDDKAQINEGVIDSDRGWEPKKEDRRDEGNKDDKKDSK